MAAFALLLVVMGLSTQSTVQAQTAPATLTGVSKYTCSDTNTIEDYGTATGTGDDGNDAKDGCLDTNATFSFTIANAPTNGLVVTIDNISLTGTDTSNAADSLEQRAVDVDGDPIANKFSLGE